MFMQTTFQKGGFNSLDRIDKVIQFHGEVLNKDSRSHDWLKSLDHLEAIAFFVQKRKDFMLLKKAEDLANLLT